MGQSIALLLATSSPASVTHKLALVGFPAPGCDLAVPADANNAVTFFMALLFLWRGCLGTILQGVSPWSFFPAFFSPSPSACYT